MDSIFTVVLMIFLRLSSCSFSMIVWDASPTLARRKKAECNTLHIFDCKAMTAKSTVGPSNPGMLAFVRMICCVYSNQVSGFVEHHIAYQIHSFLFRWPAELPRWQNLQPTFSCQDQPPVLLYQQIFSFLSTLVLL